MSEVPKVVNLGDPVDSGGFTDRFRNFMDLITDDPPLAYDYLCKAIEDQKAFREFWIGDDPRWWDVDGERQFTRMHVVSKIERGIYCLEEVKRRMDRERQKVSRESASPT